MQLRIEVKKDGKTLLQVLAVPGISDGDLAAILLDAEQDLRWNIIKDVHTEFTGGRSH